MITLEPSVVLICRLRVIGERCSYHEYCTIVSSTGGVRVGRVSMHETGLRRRRNLAQVCQLLSFAARGMGVDRYGPFGKQIGQVGTPWIGGITWHYELTDLHSNCWRHDFSIKRYTGTKKVYHRWASCADFAWCISSTRWFKRVAPNRASHECRMQEQLEYHMFDIILTAINSGREWHSYWLKGH